MWLYLTKVDRQIISSMLLYCVIIVIEVIRGVRGCLQKKSKLNGMA